MNNLIIKGRFRNYEHLVVGADGSIYQLTHFIKPKTIPFRKLKFYSKRRAYGFNGSYISKERLLNLFYKCSEIINQTYSRNYYEN